MADRLRLTINFKHNEEDIKLYSELLKKSSVSSFVKDVLKDYFKMATKDDFKS